MTASSRASLQSPQSSTSSLPLHLTWWGPVWKARQRELSLHDHNTRREVERRQHVPAGRLLHNALRCFRCTFGREKSAPASVPASTPSASGKSRGELFSAHPPTYTTPPDFALLLRNLGSYFQYLIVPTAQSMGLFVNHDAVASTTSPAQIAFPTYAPSARSSTWTKSLSFDQYYHSIQINSCMSKVHCVYGVELLPANASLASSTSTLRPTFTAPALALPPQYIGSCIA